MTEHESQEARQAAVVQAARAYYLAWKAWVGLGWLTEDEQTRAIHEQARKAHKELEEAVAALLELEERDE